MKRMIIGLVVGSGVIYFSSYRMNFPVREKKTPVFKQVLTQKDLSFYLSTCGTCSVVFELVRKMQKDGQLDFCRDHINKFLSKSKRDLRNVAAFTKNEANYLKERVEDTILNKI
ncbi:MAG: hypothetical protein ACK5KT_16490 [Dysgonomonas sp.]